MIFVPRGIASLSPRYPLTRGLQRRWTSRFDSTFNQMLMMTSGAPAVYASVSIHRRLVVLVAEKLAHNLESPWLRIQQNFRT